MHGGESQDLAWRFGVQQDGLLADGQRADKVFRYLDQKVFKVDPVHPREGRRCAPNLLSLRPACQGFLEIRWDIRLGLLLHRDQFEGDDIATGHTRCIEQLATDLQPMAQLTIGLKGCPKRMPIDRPVNSRPSPPRKPFTRVPWKHYERPQPAITGLCRTQKLGFESRPRILCCHGRFSNRALI
ncbi:hypothetical protein WR25_25608 [Diploscapter pachys]|uniref:Uncharacterized protein n=1 Tax=Diploscapter pachys TaxID=2018661 RepID=A0A2A2JYZ2_9BILA|nr:hypothetical protein WR25_25608 [Diploscapter pachys]